MAEMSTRRGREMIPMFLRSGMSERDSILADFATVEKKLLIAFGAGDVAGENGETFEAGLLRARFYSGDGLFVEGGVLDDPARGDVFAAELELGLDEDQESGVWFCGGYSGG